MKATIIVRYPTEASLVLIEEFPDGTSQEEILEKVFGWCNHGSCSEHPQFLAWKHRSLSVNDFVCVDGFWWQCKSIGWARCCTQYVVDVEERVARHPLASECAWAALDRVMSDVRRETGQPLF